MYSLDRNLSKIDRKYQNNNQSYSRNKQNFGDLWLNENVYVTPHFLSRLKAHQEAAGEYYLFDLKTENALFNPFAPPAQTAQLALFKSNSSLCGPVRMQLEELTNFVCRVPPYGPSPHSLQLPIYKDWANPITYWTQILDTNIMALEHNSLYYKDKTSVLREQGVKIHPTAWVENSTLEEGAEIEAFASVRFSHVGRSAKVAAHTILDHCVLGAGSQTLVDSHLRRVVVGQNSTVANLGLFDSVIGDDAFVTTAVSVFGQKPFQYPEIKGKILYRPTIGVCIGDGAIVGARALFQAGTALPDGALVVGRPDEVASKLDEPGLKRGKMQLGDREKQV